MSISLQQRDLELLRTIHDFDGVLSRRQIQSMFWPGAVSSGPMDKRLSKLHQLELIDKPTRHDYQRQPVPEPIVWLGWRGILEVASMNGIELYQPKKTSEYELRKVEKSTRGSGLRWLRKPRYIQLEHDIAVNDFRIKVQTDIDELPELSLEKWIPEGAFISEMDVITYEAKSQQGGMTKVKRGIRPDAWFVILDEKRRQSGLPARYRFLLELDNANHSRRRFGLEKAAAGVAYLKSDAYKTRFGSGGRWLVITTSEKRRENLAAEAGRQLDELSYAMKFSTFDEVSSSNVFVSPIWWEPGKQSASSFYGERRFGS